MTIQPQPQGPARVFWRRWNARQLRLVSGLAMFTFVFFHFLNHALGLVSIDAMEAMRQMRIAITRSLPGTIILALSALVHVALGLSRLYRTETLRISAQNLVQLLFGLLIPFLLLRHVIATRGAHSLFQINDNYTYVLSALWPGDGWDMALLMALVWVHSCIGLHHWLSLKSWYRPLVWLWYALALLIPTLAYAGFVSAGQRLKLEHRVPDALTPVEAKWIGEIITQARLEYLALLLLALVAWAIWTAANRYGSRISVTYANDRTVRAPRGLSLLAISRINGVPHASVCGGRARCSTCRVRVLAGAENLAPPSDREQQVLRRVGAPGNVRLACQIHPMGDITVSTLLPPQVQRGPDPGSDRYFWGVEQEVTVLFCDLRGFTSMSQGRLAYDVVFLLNQFLGRMAETIEDTGGYVDKFMGDGIMAIFGMDASPEEGARQAINAARAMGGVLESLNQSLHVALPAPFSIGMGLHSGSAILGRIGAVRRNESGVADLTALGETVNLASRLEAKAKELGVQVVLSASCAVRAGLEAGPGFEPMLTDVRGIPQPVAVFAVKRAANLPPVAPVQG